MVEGMKKGEFCRHIVFRDCEGRLNDPVKIAIDDPGFGNFCRSAHEALSQAMSEGGLDVPVVKHVCEPECACITEYRKDPSATEKRFSPASG